MSAGSIKKIYFNNSLQAKYHKQDDQMAILRDLKKTSNY